MDDSKSGLLPLQADRSVVLSEWIPVWTQFGHLPDRNSTLFWFLWYSMSIPPPHTPHTHNAKNCSCSIQDSSYFPPLLSQPPHLNKSDFLTQCFFFYCTIHWVCQSSALKWTTSSGHRAESSVYKVSGTRRTPETETKIKVEASSWKKEQ